MKKIQRYRDTPFGSVPDAEGEYVKFDDVIALFVDNFLQWELPEDFNPDGGITFDKKGKPTGTNLLTATQAREMVEHMLTGNNRLAENRKSLEAVKNIGENVSIPDA